MKKIALIGCTGSIGTQVLNVVRAYKEEFCITALVCGSEREKLSALQAEFSPRHAYCAKSDKGIPIEELFSEADIAFIAASGFAGLKYTLAAVRQGKTVALANKESLVCGGELVIKEAKAHKATLIPVDSEHSAIFQALSFRLDAPFSKLVLTASGGPFLHLPQEKFAAVTPKDALCHPTWKMGKKISVDSATLLNKGYEMIEAKHLFGADFERIETVVHPESIVHSLVLFEDGAALAQMGYPDMRVPIQLALTYPKRLPCEKKLDLAAIGTLHFERLPEEKFPCFTLAKEAGKAGGDRPTVLNGAAEVAVSAFLAGRISFPQIAESIVYALEALPFQAADSYEALERSDALARAQTETYIYDL